MKVNILIIILVLSSLFGYAQLPDLITISIKKDTLRDYTDCVIKITVSRKDNKQFKFTKDYLIGDVYRNNDLLYEIQKLNSQNEFEDYRCNESPIALPGLPSKVLVKLYNKINIVDSLDDLACIGHGNFRLRILFNSGRMSQSLDGNIITAKSNWIKFYVKPEETLLGYSREIDIRETKKSKQD